MSISEAKKRANRAYNERTYDRLYIFVEKRQKERIKEYARRLGKSVNEYVTSLIETDMLRHKDVISICLAERLYSSDFESFRSNVSHFLKEKGDLDFLSQVISENVIETYARLSRRKEALYLLAAVDYLSRINSIPLVNEYEALRHETFEMPVFPRDVLMKSRLLNSDEPKNTALLNAIPEFLRHNIIEGSLRDAV